MPRSTSISPARDLSRTHAAKRATIDRRRARTVKFSAQGRATSADRRA